MARAGATCPVIGRTDVGWALAHRTDFSVNTVGRGPPYEYSRLFPRRMAVVKIQRRPKRNGPPGGAGRWGRDGASGERRGESRHRAARIRATTFHKADICVRVTCKHVKIRVIRALSRARATLRSFTQVSTRASIASRSGRFSFPRACRGCVVQHSAFTQQETSRVRACRDRSRRCRYPAPRDGRERFHRRSPGQGRNRRRSCRAAGRNAR